MTTDTGRPTTRAALTAGTADWQRRSACRTVCRTGDPDLFFPVGKKNSVAQAQAEKAVAVCGPCTVREACLQWALDNRLDYGVWGGLTEQERQRLHRRKRTRFDRGNVSALDHILNDRMEEFLRLEKTGLGALGIARELGTNVQTVNRVRRVLEQREMGAAA